MDDAALWLVSCVFCVVFLAACALLAGVAASFFLSAATLIGGVSLPPVWFVSLCGGCGGAVLAACLAFMSLNNGTLDGAYGSALAGMVVAGQLGSSIAVDRAVRRREAPQIAYAHRNPRWFSSKQLTRLTILAIPCAAATQALDLPDAAWAILAAAIGVQFLAAAGYCGWRALLGFDQAALTSVEA